jgi:hypothetical protein
VIDIQTLAALPAKTGFVLLTDRKGFTIRMVSTLHLLLPSVKINITVILPKSESDLFTLV